MLGGRGGQRAGVFRAENQRGKSSIERALEICKRPLPLCLQSANQHRHVMKRSEARKRTTGKDYREQLLQLTQDQPSFLLQSGTLAIYTHQLGEAGGGGMDWEFEISRCKLLYVEWVNNKVLLYSTGNYIQYPVINHNGKEYEKEYIYI